MATPSGKSWKSFRPLLVGNSSSVKKLNSEASSVLPMHGKEEIADNAKTQLTRKRSSSLGTLQEGINNDLKVVDNRTRSRGGSFLEEVLRNQVEKSRTDG